MSSTEYRNVAYVQYRDVQVPKCPDTGISPYEIEKKSLFHIGSGADIEFGPKNAVRKSLNTKLKTHSK